MEKIVKDDIEAHGQKIEPKPDFNPFLTKRINFESLSHEEQAELISKRPEYGKIICRCETITEGEILDAINSPIIPSSIDAIKRRTRAGMGRCQGGFCQPRVLEILARELGKEWTEINLRTEGTNILKKTNR
jgi:glycerol-3-phosphate dehydrogenase